MADITRLRGFVAVAQAGNISRAAEVLFVAQPALSQQIKYLEADLGVVLFERLPRGVKLTPEGELLLSAATRVLREFERFEEQAAALRDRRGVELKVGLMAHGAGELMPEILRLLREEHADVTLRLRQFNFEDPTVGVGRGLVDVGFVTGPVDPVDGIEYVTLRFEPIVAAVATDHPIAGRHEVSIHDLIAYRFVTDTLAEGAWHDFWLAMSYRKPGAAVDKVTFAMHDETLDAVALNLGVSICPASTPRFYPRPGVTWIPVNDIEPAPLNLLWRPEGSDPIVGRFIECARRAAQLIETVGTPAATA
ncbi:MULTISPECIES: LysR family transcriptional regulator [unclassified Mycolicibacterium]|uniref:LysR family transcriptional regulator n=1 Tax=unclassified Mycolicibacterium TaxID=2636767 RepID=UPI002EDA00ED